MIYFDTELQRRVFGLFVQSLHREGFLLLGPSDGRRPHAQSSGFEPDAAGEDVYRYAGVELFQSWRPHLICMDMKMPVMDGYQATRSIRVLPGGDAVKIAALTARAFQEDRGGVLAGGCNEVTIQPIELNKVQEFLARYVYNKDGASQ